MNWRDRLSWLYRLLATALGFAVFGVVGIAFKLVLLPYTRAAADDTGSHLRARRLVSGVWRMFARFLEVIGVVRCSWQGLERLGRPGQLILANHPSLLDVLFLVAHVPETNCVVKKDLLRNPVMSSPIRACGYLPNDESEMLLQQVHETLQGGQCLLIFPEGTRTGWDGEVRLHRGAVSMGLRSARVITPVVIRQSPPNFKKGQPWYRIPKVKVCYDFVVGEDIDPQTWLSEKPLPIASRRLNDYLQDYFNRESKI